MFCISPQNLTTPERILSNPFHGKSFYDEGQYRVALDRLEQGIKCLDLLIKQIEELAKIVNRQAEKIRDWSSNSSKEIRQSSEFGTSKRSWISMIESIVLVAEQDETFGKTLQAKVVNPLSEFRARLYGKQNRFSNQKKEFEKEFRKVQKPWVSLLNDLQENRDKIAEARKKFQNAQRAEDLMKNDISHDEDQIKTLSEIARKREVQLSKLKELEEDLLKRIGKKKPEYEQQMQQILEKMLDIERQRLKKFNEILESLKGVLNTDTYSKFETISQKFDAAITSQNIDEDIDKWNRDFGNNTPYAWPQISLTVSS